MKEKKQIFMLIILDGLGWGKEQQYNAVYHADTPYLDTWMREFPHAILQASGSAVGLPKNFIGNSEVGHTTIGAGRIVDSPVEKINKLISNKSFFLNPTLLNTLQRVKHDNGTLHIIGLLSDAGVHSAIEHLIAFIHAAHNFGLQKIIIHAFLDGRDTPPYIAGKYLERLEKEISITSAKIGSLHGRAYAMDRDKHWDRIEKSYNVLTEKQSSYPLNWKEVLKKAYKEGKTDEYIEPVALIPDAYIKDGDGIIFFNFRPDRTRELTAAFVKPDFNDFPRKKIRLNGFLTPFSYAHDLHTDVMFETDHIKHTLNDVLAAHGKRIFAIAETEKYAHVTYFFNGGNETPHPHEMRTLIKSKKDTINMQSSCMEAGSITDAVLRSLSQDPYDFYLINFANPDIIGHTGNFEETKKAVHCVDLRSGELYEKVVEEMNGTIFLTADHGNAEDKWDTENNQPRTSHTTNPVPFLWLTKKEQGNNKELPLKQLSDIAPFILTIMGIPVPKEMQHPY